MTDGEHPGPTATSWLAVDGGQSAVRARIGSIGQSLVREATGPGVRHRPGGTATGMLDSIEQALSTLNHPPVDVAVLGMSGLPSDAPQLNRLTEGVVAATGASRVLFSGDHVTSHAGALAGEPGVVATVGTGVAILGVAPDGQLNRVDGRGYLLGDDGSAFQLGNFGLRAVLGHAEGRHSPTGSSMALTEAAVTRYGPIEEIPHTLYRSADPVDRIARFAEDVVVAARAADPTAAVLVRDAMQQVAQSISAAAHGFHGAPIPVVVLGGLMRATDVLEPLLGAALAECLPDAQLRQPAGTPLDGAAWLAAHGPGPYADLMHIHHTTALHPGTDAFHDRGEG